MTDKKDDASKAGPPPSAGQTSGPFTANKPGEVKAADGKSADSKKPQAIVEGKAIEISATTIRPGAAKPESGKPTVGTSSATTTSGTSDASKQDAAKGAAGATSAGAATAAAAAKPANPGKTFGAPAQSMPTPGGTGSGVGSFLSHLFAGVVGGAGAWYAISTIGPELGKQYGIAMPAPHATELKIIQDDLSRLKKAAATPTAASSAAAVSPDFAAKLAAAEAEIVKLRDAAKAVAALDANQAKVAAELRALTDARTKQQDADARVAKLEERLKLMSEATGTEAGKLPQLAAVTGRLVDLETTMTNQLSALRKTVSQELENRLAATDENSNAAKSGTNRVDRELSSVKSETATIAGRFDTLKGETDRLASALGALRAETGALKTAVEAFDARLKAAAKPEDVSAAIAPVANKVGTLEQGLQSVVKAEEDRKSNAERIVLSLELNNLKRVIDRGQKYAAELADIVRISGGKVDLSALSRHKDTGLPTLADLTREFPTVANAILDSETAPPADAGVLDRMMASAKSVVRVRKVGHDANDRSLEAIVGRMETALKDGRLADAAVESRTLPPKAASSAQAYIVKLESRAAVDTAIAALEKSLKSSLAGAGKATN